MVDQECVVEQPLTPKWHRPIYVTTLLPLLTSCQNGKIKKETGAKAHVSIGRVEPLWLFIRLGSSVIALMALSPSGMEWHVNVLDHAAG